MCMRISVWRYMQHARKSTNSNVKLRCTRTLTRPLSTALRTLHGVAWHMQRSGCVCVRKRWEVEYHYGFLVSNVPTVGSIEFSETLFVICEYLRKSFSYFSYIFLMFNYVLQNTISDLHIQRARYILVYTAHGAYWAIGRISHAWKVWSARIICVISARSIGLWFVGGDFRLPFFFISITTHTPTFIYIY